MREGPRRLTLRERLAAAGSDERGVIFTLAFIIGFPHYLYPDLCSQIAEGRGIWAGTFPVTAPTAFDSGPWVDHVWLFEAIAWPFWAHGAWPLFAAICTALAAATPLVAMALARRCGASAYVASAVGYLTIVATVTSYVVRPQTFAVLFFALELVVLAGALRRPWLLLALTIAWANMHGSAVIAPIVAGLYGIGRAVERGAAPERRYVEAAGWALLGSLFTPHGIALWASAGGFSTRGELVTTADWQPVSFAYSVDLFVIVTYAAALIAGGVPLERRNTVALLFLGTFGVLWLVQSRFLPFFGIAAVPALATALGRSGLEARRGRRSRAASIHAAWLAVPLVAAIGLTAWLRAPAAVHVEPELAAVDDLVRGSGFSGRLFAPYTAGGYLQLRAEPVLVMIDSHAVPFGPDVWRDYATIDGAHRGWREALDRRAIGAVATRDDGALASALSTARRWHVARRSAGYVLYVRNRVSS